MLSVGGCKAASGTAAAESPAAQLDDIVAIESELAVNAERLEAQGVRLARVTESRADKADGPQAPDDDEASDDTSAPAPATPPAEPAPEPEPAMADEEEATVAGASEREFAAETTRSRRRATKRKQRGKKTRCERVCDLAEATCTLADRICGLADEHVDDVRYEDACDRAGAQCEAASEACSACE